MTAATNNHKGRVRPISLSLSHSKVSFQPGPSPDRAPHSLIASHSKPPLLKTVAGTRGACVSSSHGSKAGSNCCAAGDPKHSKRRNDSTASNAAAFTTCGVALHASKLQVVIGAHCSMRKPAHLSTVCVEAGPLQPLQYHSVAMPVAAA